MDPSIKYATEVRHIYPLDPCLREAHLRHSGGKISPINPVVRLTGVYLKGQFFFLAFCFAFQIMNNLCGYQNIVRYGTIWNKCSLLF